MRATTICPEQHNPGVWPYDARCTHPEGHSGGHRDRAGRTWSTTTAVDCTCTVPWHQVWHRASLSLAASAVHRIRQAHNEGSFLDAGFDGGEFSGPWHAHAAERDIIEALARLGWTAAEYNAALTARTSARFAFFSGLEAEEPQPVGASC